MHELGLLRGVVAAVRASAGPGRVEAVGITVGTLSGAVPEALVGAWPIAAVGTELEGARLEIEVVQAAVHCASCGRDQPVDDFFALRCPECGAPTANLVRGREFQVAWADVADDDHGDSSQASNTPTA